MLGMLCRDYDPPQRISISPITFAAGRSAPERSTPTFRARFAPAAFADGFAGAHSWKGLRTCRGRSGSEQCGRDVSHELQPVE